MTEDGDSLIDWTYERYPHAFMSHAELTEIVQYDPDRCKFFPPGATCAACSAARNLMRDHCHEHGWVRGIVCGSCNRQLGFVDQGIAPRVEEALLAALLAVRNRCPDCDPIEAADLTPSKPPRAERLPEEKERDAQANRVRRLAKRRAYKLVKERAHDCPSCTCGTYHLVPLLGVRQRKAFGPFTLEEAEEFLAG